MNGHLEILKWAYDSGCECNFEMFKYVSDLKILQWAVRHGFNNYHAIMKLHNANMDFD